MEKPLGFKTLSIENVFTTSLTSRIAKCASCAFKMRPTHVLCNATFPRRSAIDVTSETRKKSVSKLLLLSTSARNVNPVTLHFFTSIHNSYFILRSLPSVTTPDKLSAFLGSTHICEWAG